MFSRLTVGAITALLLSLLQPVVSWSAAPAPAPPALPQVPAGATGDPLSPLGPGDSVTLHVFGQPNMDSVLGVSDDGTINVPLAGAVQVKGLSPDDASRKIEDAFKSGGFFVNPHVSLTVTQSLSQRVSVFGEVKNPGRYPVDTKTTVIDLLAEAGGETEFGSDTAYILRPDSTGATKRYPVNLRGLSNTPGAASAQSLRAGDSVVVPRSEQFFILGEVQKPAMYKLEPNLTVIQAIAVAGGVTPRGSDHRVEIRRAGKNGQQVVIKPNPNDFVQPDDVIRVKQSIF